MKQKGFAMIILLVGILVIGVVGYVGYNVWLSNNIRHTPFIIPTISPTPIYNVDDPENNLLPTLDPNNPVELDTARKLHLVEIRNAIEMYSVDHKGNYPNTLSVLGEPY